MTDIILKHQLFNDALIFAGDTKNLVGTLTPFCTAANSCLYAN